MSFGHKVLGCVCIVEGTSLKIKCLNMALKR